MLVTTTVLHGGLYNSQEESYYSKLHHKSIEASEQHDTTPLLGSSTATASSGAPSSSLVALSAVGFLAAYGEGAMVTWCVIYFERYISVPNSLQGIGFFTFMICMALGRFTCDFLRKTFGRRKLIRVSGALAGLGVSFLIIAPSLKDQFSQIFLSEVGVGLTGLGLSTIIPTIFSSAGHLPGMKAGTSIATVAVFIYCGSILAPSLTGGISQGLHSLRYAFVFIAILVSLMFPLSYGIPPE
jgi:MFS family permease